MSKFNKCVAHFTILGDIKCISGHVTGHKLFLIEKFQYI